MNCPCEKGTTQRKLYLPIVDLSNWAGELDYIQLHTNEKGGDEGTYDIGLHVLGAVEGQIMRDKDYVFTIAITFLDYVLVATAWAIWLLFPSCIYLL